MKITLTSIMVNDQNKALTFYTEIIGFHIKHDIPMGEFRWLTVTAPEGVNGVELVLEPIAFEPAKTYQQALFNAGIPATAFMTDDIFSEVARLTAQGVKFRSEPNTMGSIIATMFEDTCGNLINLVQPNV